MFLEKLAKTAETLESRTYLIITGIVIVEELTLNCIIRWKNFVFRLPDSSSFE